MNSCNTGDHTIIDHIHAHITTCNTEEPQQKYRPGTASKRPLSAPKPLLCTLYFYLLLIYDLFAEMAASDSFALIVLL